MKLEQRSQCESHTNSTVSGALVQNNRDLILKATPKQNSRNYGLLQVINLLP